MLGTVALALRWALPVRAVAAWSPSVSVGYVRAALGSVMVRPDQLPPFARDSLPSADAAGPARPTTVAGHGARFAMGADRALSRATSIVLEMGVDRIAVERMRFGQHTIPLAERGAVRVARFSALLRYSPISNSSPNRISRAAILRPAASGSPSF